MATSISTADTDGNANYNYDPSTGGLIRVSAGGSGTGGSSGTGGTAGSDSKTNPDGSLKTMEQARADLLNSLSSPLGASYLNTANWVNPYSPIMPVGEFPGSAGAVNPWEGLGMKLSQHQYTPPVYQRSGPANYGTYQSGVAKSNIQAAARPTGDGTGVNTGGSTAPAPGSVPGSYVPPYSAPKSPSTTYAMTNQYNPFMEANRRLELRGQDPYYTNYSSTPDKTLYPVEQTEVPWLAPYVNDPNPVITGTGYVPDYLKQRAADRGVTYATGGEVSGAEDYGRHGDSMLVHMAPSEVMGLAALAKQNGRELTTNPHTGYPEAFSLRDLLLPAVQLGLTYMTGGAGAGAAAGLAGGAAGASAAGAGLGAGLSTGLGAVLSSPITHALVPGVLSYAQNGDMKQALGAAGMGWAGGQLLGNMGQLGAQGAEAGATDGYFSNVSKGFGKIMSNPDTAMGFFKDNAVPIGAGVMGALTYESANMDNQAGEREAEQEEKKRRIYNNIRNTYTAQGRNSNWLNGYAEGGEVQPFRMESGGFVLPADVVRKVGGGDPERGLTSLQNNMGAVPIRGPGTGTSDSIPATIDGKEPALLSNQEAYVPKHGVKSLGGPDSLYNFMQTVRGKKAK